MQRKADGMKYFEPPFRRTFPAVSALIRWRLVVASFDGQRGCFGVPDYILSQ